MSSERGTASPGAGRGLPNRDAWLYFAGFYRGRWLRLTLLVLISTFLSLLVVPTLLLVKHAFDVAIPTADVRMIVVIGAAILLMRLLSTFVALRLRRAHLKTITSAMTSIRESLLRKLYTFSRQTYTEMDREKTHARIVQDTNRIFDMSNVLLATMVPSMLTSVVLFIVLIMLNPRLMLILLALLPVLAIASVLSGRSVKKAVVRYHRAFEQFSKGMSFVLHHLELTQLQSSQTQEIQRQLGKLEALGSANSEMAYRFAAHGQVQGTLTGAGIVIILVVGGVSVAMKQMTIGDFVAFYVAAGLLNSYFNHLAGGMPQIIAGSVSLKTLHAFSSTSSSPPYHGTRKIDFRGTVRLDSASFSYGRDEVLRGVSLTIEPNRITALVGGNGAGKSTIAHLVLGLYRPTHGMVYADSIPYSELDVAHLREMIAVVPQHPELFAGSIHENLTYGSEQLDRPTVIAAAKAALLDEFVRILPDGYDTQVGSDGVLLSGGQCQRMAVARALLRAPRLLILDEPTNHLDTDTVRQLLRNIRKLADRISILLISHDPMVISTADTVYHLKDGMLVEQPELLHATSSG